LNALYSNSKIMSGREVSSSGSRRKITDETQTASNQLAKRPPLDTTKQSNNRNESSEPNETDSLSPKGRKIHNEGSQTSNQHLTKALTPKETPEKS
jgi:hypothetical protein